jgi:hypothetical protein
LEQYQKGETMGRKGAIKRKPKKSKSLSSENNNLSSNARPDDKFAQPLGKDKRLITNSEAEARPNKKGRKGK